MCQYIIFGTQTHSQEYALIFNPSVNYIIKVLATVTDKGSSHIAGVK
jgi:hypothetical protein